MSTIIKYCSIFSLLTLFTFSVQSQNLCEYEVKVINKQKKKVKAITESIVKEWYAKNATSLKLPETLHFSKIKFKPNESKTELKKWSGIDSILCVKKSEQQLIKGFSEMRQLKLVIFEISATFNFKNSLTPLIKSLLYFEFDINGDLIRAVIREKESSPYTEKYYYN